MASSLDVRGCEVVESTPVLKDHGMFYHGYLPRNRRCHCLFFPSGLGECGDTSRHRFLERKPLAALVGGYDCLQRFLHVRRGGHAMGAFLGTTASASTVGDEVCHRPHAWV